MVKFPIDIKNTKHAIAIVSVVGAAALYAYVSFILLPQISGTAKIYDKAKRARVDVISSERDVAKVAALKKQVELYYSKIDSYERMLPAEQEVPKLLEDLSTMAKKSGVKILGITPVQSKETAQSGQIYQEIPILINAISGYHELGRFLSDLESADRFMKVADIQISANKANSKKHDVELLVLTYKLLRSGQAHEK